MKQKLKLVLGIAIISLLGQPMTMLSPALSTFQSSFPDVAETTIQSLITLPSLVSIPFFFVGGLLSRKVSTKHMVNLGIILISIGGLLPAVLQNFTLILVCRAVMGMGIGFLSPFSQSLISDNFSGRDITLLFGIQAAAISAGNMIGCYISGALAAFNYQASFLCYLLGPIALVAALICVPNVSEHPAEPGKSALQDYLHIPLDLWLRYLFQIVFALVYFSYFNNASLLIAEKGLGNTSDAGFTTALSSLIGIAAGLLMPKIHDCLKRCMVPAMTGVMALGMLAMDSYCIVFDRLCLLGNYAVCGCEPDQKLARAQSYRNLVPVCGSKRNWCLCIGDRSERDLRAFRHDRLGRTGSDRCLLCDNIVHLYNSLCMC